jgi:pseudouridine-5'-phosphate glycosidase
MTIAHMCDAMAWHVAQSVSVVGYGTPQFPAFFTQDSGVKAQLQRDSPEECAKLIHESLSLELPNGFVFAVPNPNPVPTDVIDGAIEVRRPIFLVVLAVVQV